MGGLFSWIQSLFWEQHMEIAIVGLQSAGKSTFVNIISGGNYVDNLMPTVGFNMHKIQKNDVQIKLWDLAGQEKFRPMWERYCRGVQSMVFVLDSADSNNFTAASKELASLLTKGSLNKIPLLVLANKNDLPNAVTNIDDITKILDLPSYSSTREIAIYSISCKNGKNIDVTMQWLIKHAKAS